MKFNSVTLTISFLLIFSVTKAQDTHYWTQQFGTESALLSGAVVGGNNDNTMIYYNPGALGFLDNSSISVNANAYRIENIKIENALGEKADFKSSQLGSVPLLTGGMINIKDKRWKIGYSFMSPVQFNFKGIARKDGYFDIIDETESPGKEEFVGESGISSKLSEILIVLGAARKLNENWSVGLSNLFTIRSNSYLRNFSTYTFMNNPENTLVSAQLSQNVDYYNVRYAAKVGIAYKKDKWRAGLTVTSPSINIMGVGTVAANISAYNLKVLGDNRITAVATDRQSELKTKFKSPLSISAGLNYDGNRSRYGISVQYYASLGVYDIMDIQPSTFIRPADLAPELGSDEFMNVKAAAKSVINVAIGYKYLLKENITLYLSARSDMSYYDDDLTNTRGIRTAISSWDIYHFASGVTFNRRQSSLSLGLLYSTGGTSKYEQNGNTNPDDLSFIEGVTTITNANYNSIGLLLGYTFYFKKF